MAIAQIEASKDNPHLGPRDEFIAKNLKLAHKICGKYQSGAAGIGLTYDDIFSFACEGLLLAYERFDPTKTKAKKFSTFAYPYISGRIKTYMTRTNPGLKHSPYAKEAVIRILKNHWEDLPIDEIVQKSGFKKRYVEDALYMIKNGRPASIDAPMKGKNGTEDTTFQEIWGADEDYSNIVVEDFFSLLTEKEQLIVSHLMQGYNGVDIGRVMGVSHQWVRQIIKGIKKKATNYMSGKGRSCIVNTATAQKIEEKTTIIPRTKENYLMLREAGKTDKEIAKIFGMPNSKNLWQYKHKWGLTDKSQNDNQAQPRTRKDDTETAQLHKEIQMLTEKIEQLLSENMELRQEENAKIEQLQEMDAKVNELERRLLKEQERYNLLYQDKLTIEDKLIKYERRYNDELIMAKEAQERQMMIEEEQVQLHQTIFDIQQELHLTQQLLKMKL